MKIAIFDEQATSVTHEGRGEAKFSWQELDADRGDRPLEIAENLTVVSQPQFDESAESSNAAPRPDPAAQQDVRALRRGRDRIQWFAEFLQTPELNPGGVAVRETRGDDSVVFLPQVNVGGATDFALLRRTKKLLKKVSEYDRVTFVLGSCLFSARSVRAHLENGSRLDTPVLDVRPEPRHVIREIRSDPRPNLYEVQVGTMVARMAAALASVLSTGIPVDMVVQVPRVQYYLQLFDLYAQETLTREALEHWMGLVDGRHELQGGAIEAYLRRYLAANDVHTPHIHVSNFLADLVPLIHSKIAHGGRIESAEAVDYLAGTNPFWRVVAESKMPSSLREVANTSYTVEYLDLGAARRAGEKRLLIVVEDVSEHRIFTAADGLARKADLDFSSCAVYPMGRVLTPWNGRLMSAYYRDPGHVLVDQDGIQYTPEEIVDAVYPVRDEVPFGDGTG
ncbi:hypothetical protein ACFZAR_34635 [Streptomyces sp. NPDC008222]|uniref:hypothetical protein n=1 Tax=Streptomyces sp. NPDC008222 TaxID=3364820 RepID=UPI0036F177C6